MIHRRAIGGSSEAGIHSPGIAIPEKSGSDRDPFTCRTVAILTFAIGDTNWNDPRKAARVRTIVTSLVDGEQRREKDFTRR